MVYFLLKVVKLRLLLLKIKVVRIIITFDIFSLLKLCYKRFLLGLQIVCFLRFIV